MEEKDDKIWVTASYTMNLGNYESLKIEAGFSQTRRVGEEPYKTIGIRTKNLLNKIIEKGNEVRQTLKDN
jgi:hypothetical protein